VPGTFGGALLLRPRRTEGGHAPKCPKDISGRDPLLSYFCRCGIMVAKEHECRLNVRDSAESALWDDVERGRHKRSGALLEWSLLLWETRHRRGR
jgi:hypothetical protein